MIDVEGFGGKFTGPITSIGMAMFDKEGVHESIELNLDWHDERNPVKVDTGALMWWLKRVRDGDLSLFEKSSEGPVHQFITFIDVFKPDLFWAKDADYDMVKMLEPWLLNKSRMNSVPWRAPQCRSVRTAFDLARLKDPTFQTRPEGGTSHTAETDAIFQAQAIIKAYEILGVEL
jgi:hypothetical protein